MTLRIAARQADLTNWQVGLDAFVRKSRLLERYCDEVGRPFERDHPDPRPGLPHLRQRRRRAGLVRLRRGWRPLGRHTGTDEYLADNLVGTVDQVTEKAQAFVDAGCRGFLLWLRDYPADETLRRFATEVIPRLEVPGGGRTSWGRTAQGGPMAS